MSTAGVLQIEILAGIARLSDDMKRAERVVGDSTGKMEKSVVSLQSQFSKLGMGLSIGLMIDEARRLTDSYIKVTAQMRIATATQAEYAKGMDEVRRISTAAQSGIEATTMLYTRLTNGLRQHGATQQDVGRITETVALGLKAYGATTAEAASAMLQLSQAFASNRLGGEEFRAVSEAMPNLMISLAKSMGVPKSALRDLSMEGKITSEVMMKAWNDPALIASLQKQAEMTRTITGELTVFRNNLTMLVGEFMGASGSTSGITTNIRRMSDAVMFLGKNLDSVITILSAYLGYLALLQVKSVLAWGQSRLVMMAHTQALAANAAGEVAHSVVVAAAATQETAARHLRLMAQREEFIASMAATQAALAGVLTAEARTAAELKYAASIEVVTTAHVQAIAMERARTTAMVASTAAEITRTSALAASGVAAIGWGTSVSTAIAMVGTAVSAAVLANPIGAAVLAIGAITLAIVNWETIVKASKATFDGFALMIDSLKWGAEATSISLGKMFAQIQLGWMHTTKQITTEQYRAMWKQIEADAEQAKIDLIKIQKDGVDHEKLAAAEKYAAARKDWEKLTNTKAQQRQAEIAALNEEYLKIITGQKMSQAEQLAEAERYNVALKNINDKYSKEATTAAANAHTSKMEQMAIQMAAETNAEKGHLTNSQKVSLAWAELKHKEQTTQEALNYVKAQGIAIALDEKDAQAELQKQLDSGQVAYAKYWAEVATTTEKLKEHNDNMAFENSLIGKTKDEIVALTKLREDEALVKAQSGMVTLLSNEHTLAEIDAQKALIIELMRAKDLREGKAGAEAAAAAVKAETEAQKKMWHEVDGFAHTAFNNILDKGKNAFAEIGNAIKKYILDMLYKMTVQKWMISVGLAGTGAAGAAAAAENTNQISGMVSGAQNMWNMGSNVVSGIGSMFGSAATGMAAFTSAQMSGAVMATSYTAPAIASLGAEAGAAASGLGALGSAAMTALPWIAGAVAIYSLFSGSKGTPTRSTGDSAMSFSASGEMKDRLYQQGHPSTTASDAMVTGMQSAYMKAAMSLGIGTAATYFGYAGNTGKNGQSPNFALVGGAGSSRFYQAETTSSDAAIQLAASRAVFAALKGSDLPPYLAKMFDGLTASAMTQQDIDGVMAFASSVKKMREGILETRTPFEVFSSVVADVSAQLGTSAATFNADFMKMTESVSGSQTGQLLVARWTQLGDAIKAIDLIKLQTLSDQLQIQAQIYAISGDAAGAASVLEQQHSIALKSLNPELRRLQKELWGLEASSKTAADALKIQTDSLSIQAQIYALTGDAAGAASVLEKQRIIELDALNKQNPSGVLAELTTKLWDLQDAAKFASQRAALNIRIMELSGDADGALAAQRRIELKAMDASVKPLQRIVTAMEDIATAASALNSMLSATQKLLLAQGDPVGAARTGVTQAKTAYTAALTALGVSFGTDLATTIAYIGKDNDIIGAFNKLKADMSTAFLAAPNALIAAQSKYTTAVSALAQTGSVSSSQLMTYINGFATLDDAILAHSEALTAAGGSYTADQIRYIEDLRTANADIISARSLISGGGNPTNAQTTAVASATNALADLVTANTSLAKAITTLTELETLMAGIDYGAATLGMSAYNKTLYDITKTTNESIAKASELHATEAELNRIRAYGTAQTRAATKAEADALAKTNLGWQQQIDVLTKVKTQREVDLANALVDTNASTALLINKLFSLQDAAALAKTNLGWQQQIDVLTKVKTQREVDLANALVDTNASTARLVNGLFALQDAAELAKIKLGWQNQLDVLSGAKTQTQIDRATKLVGVTDAATIAIINQVFALEDLMTSVSTAFGALQRAVKAERDAVTVAYETSSKSVADSIKTVSTAVDKLKSLSDALKSSLSGLIEPSRAVGQSQLASALAIARAGGALPSAESLQPALSAIAKPSAGLFTNFVDYQRDFIRTANDITSLGEITDKQLTAQRTQLDVLEAQVVLMKTAYDADMKQFDSVLTNAQNQIDVLNNIDNSVIGVAQALLKMADALRVADAAKEAAKLAPYKAVYSNATSVAGSSKAVNVTTGGAATGTTAGTVILTASGQVALGLTGGWSASQVAAQIANNIAAFTRSGENDKVNAIKDYAKSINLPGYAVGANELLNDGPIFAHAGEQIKPAAYVDMDKSARDETNALLRRLTASNDEMKKELTEIKKSNYRIQVVEEKWDVDGTPSERLAA